MILDQIDSALLYGGLGKRIAAGLSLLSEESVLNAPVGRYEVQNSDLYYMVQEYETKPAEEGRFEIHHKYMDIQAVISGTEYIGYTLLDELREKQPYDGEKDIALYHASPIYTKAILGPGMFAIFWPNEPHMPCRTLVTPEFVRKIVIKVPIE